MLVSSGDAGPDTKYTVISMACANCSDVVGQKAMVAAVEQLQETARQMSGDAVLFVGFSMNPFVSGLTRIYEVFAWGSVVKLSER